MDSNFSRRTKTAKRWRNSYLALLLVAIAATLLTTDLRPAEASHRTQWRVYPVIFYGNNQTYDSNWRTYSESMLKRVQNWYQAKVGETFTIGTWITRQGANPWAYYANGDTWNLVKNELNASGEHVLQSGYVYLVFFAGGGGFAGGSTACSGNCGYTLVGHYVVESYQRSADHDPWKVSNYQSQIGTIAHELGHAMNIGPHVFTDNNLMGYQWNWPTVNLNSTQVSALQNNPFFAPAAGSAPATPSNVSITQATPTGWYNVTWFDNSTNELHFELRFHTSEGSDWRSSFVNGGGYSGTGWRSASVYAYRKADGSVSGSWWACVQAVGSTKDSGSVCTSPGSAVIAARPSVPASLSIYGADDGYFGGLFVCHHDSSSDEAGFMHGLEGNVWPDHWFKWGPPVSGTGTWTCQWVPTKQTTWYRFRVTSFKPGNSSTTGFTAWEYGD